MNYKLEKFWNIISIFFTSNLFSMNYKLEKFWNFDICTVKTAVPLMNYKLEKFWNENSTSSEKSITYQIYNSFTFNGVSEDTKNSIIENLQEKLNELERKLEKMKEERETYARTSL